MGLRLKTFNMSNNIRGIVEDRVSAYLSANITGVTIHKGITDEDRVVPIIICHASDSNKPSAFGAGNLGNYRVTLKVYIYSSADDDTLATHRTRVTNVLALLAQGDGLKNYWGAEVTYGKLYALWIESDSEGMSQRRYGNAITFTLNCCMPTQS
jgi:hypothetical protein